jgi:enoyl-CoA hydratase/carnithine racemase
MSDRDPVRLDFDDGGVATVSLARSERSNAFSIAMRDSLWEILLAVRAHPGVSAVLLRADGQHFSVGADLSEFGTASSQFAARRVRFQRPLWELLWSMPQPIVAALHGYVLGSGFELALMCDLRVASADAQFALPEIRFGMLPAAGGTQTLTRAVGLSRALSAVLTGEWLDAPSALAGRVVDEILEDVEAGAVTRAAQLAELGPLRARIAKQAIRRAVDLPARAARLGEARLARLLAASDASTPGGASKRR